MIYTRKKGELARSCNNDLLKEKMIEKTKFEKKGILAKLGH